MGAPAELRAFLSLYKTNNMKTLTLILTTGFLFLCFSSYAQVKTDPENTHPYPESSVVTKGYYSIGNNAEKLGRSSSWGITTGDSYPPIPKGYYSIGNNNRKLRKQLVIKGEGKRSIPVITKGYYSIGRNSEKLKQ
jgi:hypothetical protein